MSDQKKNPAEAEFYFNNCIKVNPNKFDAYNELGVVYFNTGNFSKAIMMFENALSRNPRYKQILLNLSGAYKAIGDNEKSQMYLTQANMLR
jgi:tetratricopeptide (TPR) repeat protein